MTILLASIFGIFSFDYVFAESIEFESNTDAFVTTDRNSYTSNLDIVISGNAGDLELPITLEIQCNTMPDSILYYKIYGGKHDFQVNESGNFKFSLRTIEFNCNKQTDTVTIKIQGTSASTSFQMIKWDENAISSISASTDKTSYQKGDSVIFSGKITNYEFGRTVSYVMDDPEGYPLSRGMIVPDSDGVFSYTFESVWELWRLDGNYEIKFHYNNDLSIKSKLTYYYSIPINLELEPTDLEPTDLEPTELEPTEPEVSLEESFDEIKDTDIVDNSDSQNSVKQDKKTDSASEQLDFQTQNKIKSLDPKIFRAQSQYDEYLKQYNYYEGKTLSAKDEQKFQVVIKKLTFQKEKIDSMINEQNLIVLESDSVVEIIEDKIEPPQPAKQIEEKPQKEMFCFLFWCW